MRFIKSRTQQVIGLFLLSTIAVLPGEAQSIVPGKFNFKTFVVNNQSQLAVENINNQGLIVGYLKSTLAPNPFQGWARFPNGNVQRLTDPKDKNGLTFAEGVNDQGVIVGQYFDTAAGHYAGFFFYKGKYTTYNVPGLPANFNTLLFGINNDLTDLCGAIQDPTNNFFTSAFVADSGHVTIFTVPNAILTEAIAINNQDQAVGIYEDANQVFHGFIRDSHGHLTFPIDVPGATTTPGLGTVSLGINDFGFVSGHFWDAANAEHGFLLTPDGQFFQIDVPNATATGGGGLNNLGQVVGHYNDTSGNQILFIATLEEEEDD